jgi:hypothetical protein
MQFNGWMLDVARDQSPRVDALISLFRRSHAAGYNAVGLYLEHRFGYPSAPWAAGPGCLTPADAKVLSASARAAGVRLIAFLNTLGHMEGFVRSEGGRHLAEGEETHSVQICPSRDECVRFARGLVEDALAAFDDEWVHLGGDETKQLGQCPQCASRAASIGKAGIYAEYFGPLCRWVLERGRRPCLWADMLIEHPAALDALPRETLLFDWQYFNRPHKTTAMLRERGFDVICCPSIQSYNSGWCFLDETRHLIDEHADDARRLGALGVLVTTWEFTYFSTFESVAPLVFAAGRRLAAGDDWRSATAFEGGEAYAQAAEILGVQVPAAARLLAPGSWRLLREHLVMRQNPFSLWRMWRGEACGPVGDEILRRLDAASGLLPAEHALRFPIELHRVAVEWVRLVEHAAQAYSAGNLPSCAAILEDGPQLLERLRPHLTRVAEGGGSRADLARLDRLQVQARATCDRLRALPADGPWRPAFETLVHDRCIPGDQAAWRCRWD